MTEHPPRLTDRRRLAQGRARAAAAPVTFLHEEAMAEIEERLVEVNRRFTAPAIVSAMPDLWRRVAPEARVVGDDPVLDLAPGAHDLVIHAMCLHWADDPVGQVIQCARALRPDGLFLGVFPGGRTLGELRSALARAEAEVSEGLSPRVLPMIDLADAAGFLQRAGLALPVADISPRNVVYQSLFQLMRDLRGMGEGNALDARRRVPARRALFDRADALYLRDPEAGAGLRATFELVFLAGWAPHPDQPKPLRPGSAAVRLADALGTVEREAGDAAVPRRDD